MPLNEQDRCFIVAVVGESHEKLSGRMDTLEVAIKTEYVKKKIVKTNTRNIFKFLSVFLPF